MSEHPSISVVRLPLVVPPAVSESVHRLLRFGYDQFDSHEEIPAELFDDFIEVDEWLGYVRTMEIPLHRVGLMTAALVLLSLLFLPELVQFFAGETSW